MIYGNQKIIEIRVRDGYLREDNKKARKLLNGAAYKLYNILYFECAGIIPFSPQYIQDNFGISKSSVHRAFAELQEKGYIAHVSDNHYIFYSAGTPI